MAGRIKLLKEGVRIHEPDFPELGYEYENPTGHDAVCGTYLLNDYQLPHPECPQKFVCDSDGASEVLKQFAQCSKWHCIAKYMTYFIVMFHLIISYLHKIFCSRFNELSHDGRNDLKC